MIDKTRAQAFHHGMAHLIFTGIWCREDAQTAIAFLATQVRKPDENDWKKMRRLIGYLKRTIKIPLIMRVDDMNVIKWWVDASYFINENMWGNMGGTTSMGKNGWGSTIRKPKKQKLNTKILTEAELIRADNSIPQMLWIRYFLEVQGYSINKNVLYQDNMSAMLLEKNGKNPVRRTQNISTCGTIS